MEIFDAKYKGNDVHKCDYCENNMIIPNKYIDKYINKNLYNHNKLEQICRISDIAYVYILENYPDTFKKLNNVNINFEGRIILDYGKYHRIRLFLFYNELTRKASMYTCDMCARNACMFHYIHSCFLIHKCDKCNKITVICGWCQEETTPQYYCQHCDEYKNLMYVQ